jgi:hypothetical protein
MMWLITLILTVIYIIWLSRLISFGVNTATRIAVASETTALTMAALYQTLSPEAKERAAMALADLRQAPAVPQKPIASGGGVATFLIVGTLIAFVVLFASMARAGERDGSRSLYDRNGSFAGSTITHGNSTSRQVRPLRRHRHPQQRWHHIVLRQVRPLHGLVDKHHATEMRGGD